MPSSVHTVLSTSRHTAAARRSSGATAAAIELKSKWPFCTLSLNPYPTSPPATMATTWLLREPLKATAPVNFSQGRLGLAATSRDARDHLQYVCTWQN